MTEQELITKAVNGDEDSYTALYNKHYHFIRNVIDRLDDKNAEDITQETFMRAFSKLKSFKFRSSFRTWLYRIAKNEFLMRKRNVRNAIWDKSLLAGDDKEVFERLFGNYNPQLELRIDLTKALNTLSSKNYMLAQMCWVDGYMHNEVSDVLGVPIGTTKSDIHRLRKTLRASLCQPSQ